MLHFSHVALLVSDLEAMESFFSEVFEMRVVWKKPGDKLYLTTGNGDILGLQVGKWPGRKPVQLNSIDRRQHVTPNFVHFGPVIEDESHFNEIFRKVEDMGIEIAGPKVSRDQSKSFYFLDPEGNCIQVVYVPPGYFEK